MADPADGTGAALAELRAANLELHRLIRRARDAGAPWSAVAEALGLTQLAAIERHVGPPDPADSWSRQDVESHVAALMSDG